MISNSIIITLCTLTHPRRTANFRHCNWLFSARLSTAVFGIYCGFWQGRIGTVHINCVTGSIGIAKSLLLTCLSVVFSRFS